MGKIFVNKNGKTHVHTLSTEKKSSINSNNDYRLSFLYGDKIVFYEDIQDINYGDYMFNACNVEVIKGTINVQNTANYMFSGYLVNSAVYGPKTRLKEVDIKCTTTSAKDMFSYNPNLETVKLELPNAITCANIFYECPKLRHVEIQAPNVTTLEAAFRKCSSLEHIDISSFASTASYKNTFYGCSNLVSVTLPTTLSGLSKAGMFEECSSLLSVEINLLGSTSGFTYTTFRECTSMHTLSGDWSNLTTVGEDAEDNYKIFKDCTALINFNADISGVVNGDELFYNCISLENFTSSIASLISGLDMFLRCKLNLQSVTNIINSIMTENTNTNEGSRITLGVDKNIKNEVTSFLENKGIYFIQNGDDEPNSNTMTITNSVGYSWFVDINWN